MKLIYYIMLRVSIFIFAILAVWAGLFYFTIVEEVQEETDDVLEDYSAMIIQNFLAGEPMPANDNGSNNTYYVKSISTDSLSYAKSREGFFSEKMFIEYKNETEPARILRQIFKDREGKYYQVTVITPTIDQGDLIDAIWNSLALLFILLLVAVLLINVLAIKGGLRPLKKFLFWLNNSNIEDSTTPTIEEGKIREIKDLSSAIVGFASRGKKAFEQQKEFIGNASHELQTPIAICQNHLEMLLESELTENQTADVVECINTLTRLSKLNKSLLMLTKIENGGFENHLVDVNEIVKRNVLHFEDIYAARNISLTIEEQANLSVNANKELITTLVVNLIKNSYSHNVDGGVVQIVIGSDFLRITNSGNSISLNNEKIYNRFYQDFSKAGSYGLGLSIVQSICKLYDFLINYSFVNSLHQFTIKLK